MRDIKFEYIWKHDSSIARGVYTIDEIQSGCATPPRSRTPILKCWERIAIRQYTGIKDKKGVECFEGDVLSGRSRVFGDIAGVVELSKYTDNEEYAHEYHFGWNVCGVPLIDLIGDGLEVIGNIHQNPEICTTSD